MIAFIDEFIDMSLKGDLPVWRLAAYVVKELSIAGEQQDFDRLPHWLKRSVRDEIDVYKSTKKWLIIWSEGEEDFSSYADSVIATFDFS